jgi:hypothetical protein
MRSMMVLVVATVIAGACASPTREPVAPAGTDGERSGAAAAVASTPSDVERKCHETFSDVAVCPRVLPLVDDRYRVRAFDQEGYVVLDVSSNAPYPRLTRENAPPRFAHVVIKVGDLAEALPFDVPSRPAPLPEVVSDSAVNVGDFTWGEIRGTLVVAPDFPLGGIDGGHLVFIWSDDDVDVDVAVSLHGWKPLRDAAATLATVVSSIAG